MCGRGQGDKNLCFYLEGSIQKCIHTHIHTQTHNMVKNSVDLVESFQRKNIFIILDFFPEWLRVPKRSPQSSATRMIGLWWDSNMLVAISFCS